MTGSSELLRIGAGATGRSAFLPQLFPTPEPGRYLDRQWESELVRKHTHLSAMMSFVRKHVAQHFHANRPRLSPAVSVKLFDAARIIAECFSEHLRTAGGAVGQSRTGLLWRAVCAVELPRNFQVRGGQPNPLGADVVHVGEDGDDRAGLAGRFGSPGARVEMFDEHLIHALISRKDLGCRSAELRVNVVSRRGHVSALLDLYYFLAGPPEGIQFVRQAEPRRDLRLAFFTRPALISLLSVSSRTGRECPAWEHY
jgi:hypothetical protein